jgi:hypothetical protein
MKNSILTLLLATTLLAGGVPMLPTGQGGLTI